MDRIKDASAHQVRDLEGKMADLRKQLDNERARADELVTENISISSVHASSWYQSQFLNVSYEKLVQGREYRTQYPRLKINRADPSLRRVA